MSKDMSDLPGRSTDEISKGIKISQSYNHILERNNPSNDSSGLRLRSDRILLIATPDQLALHIPQSILDPLFGPLGGTNDFELHRSTMTRFEGLLVTLGDGSFFLCIHYSIVVGV